MFQRPILSDFVRFRNTAMFGGKLGSGNIIPFPPIIVYYHRSHYLSPKILVSSSDFLLTSAGARREMFCFATNLSFICGKTYVMADHSAYNSIKRRFASFAVSSQKPAKTLRS